MLQSIIMEWAFLREFKPYKNICRGFLREFFTKIPYQVYLDLVKEFYLNLKIEYLSLNTLVNGTHICIQKDHFCIMFELSFYGVSYIYDGSIKLNNFKLSIAILFLVINLMEWNKLSIKARFLKAKIRVTHYFLTHRLLPR